MEYFSGAWHVGWAARKARRNALTGPLGVADYGCVCVAPHRETASSTGGVWTAGVALGERRCRSIQSTKSLVEDTN